MVQVRTKLLDIAYARSGDKGDGANIGVLAYTEAGYQWMAGFLTAEVVEAYFKPMGVGTVIRYELPNLLAFNFILPHILAGGGSRSLRVDAQGKVLGQALLLMPIEISEAELEAARRKD